MSAMFQYIIVKNPEAVKTKYFGKDDWTYNRDEAVKFSSIVNARHIIKDLTCHTCEIVTY